MLQDGILSNRQAFCILGSFEHHGKILAHEPCVGILAQPGFFQYHTSFLINFCFVEQVVEGPVFQYGKSFLHHLRIRGRNGQHINRFIETGIGIQVGTEFHTHFLQVIHQFILGKILGAVEVHVFHKMRKAQLVLVFQDGTNIDGQAEFNFFLRLGILTYVIPQPIRKGSHFHIGINRDRLRQVELAKALVTG